MDLEELTSRCMLYSPNVDSEWTKKINMARNSYAIHRLLGNGEVANNVRTELNSKIKQARYELQAELDALRYRMSSVVDAIDLLDDPVDWPLWPNISADGHDYQMDTYLHSHRRQYKNKLEFLKSARK